MSQDQKDKTRDKMRRGGLPGPTKDEPWIRSGVGHRCDGCDEKIDIGETEYNVTVLVASLATKPATKLGQLFDASGPPSIAVLRLRVRASSWTGPGCTAASQSANDSCAWPAHCTERRTTPKEETMLKAFVGAVALTVAVSAAAFAADVEGKIKSVDTTERSFLLDDGTKIWIGDSVSMDKIKEGSDVKASYEDKDGKNMATTVEVKD